MITDLHITKLRGIQDLSISQLARVNIFIGRNGTGKTTALESLVFATNPLNHELPKSVASWRGIATRNNDAIIRTLLYQLDPSNHPRIRITLSHGSRYELAIIPTTQPNRSMAPDGTSPAAQPSSQLGGDVITGCELQFIDLGESLFEKNEARPDFPRHFSPQASIASAPGCFFISARQNISISETAEALSNAVQRRSDGIFLEALKCIDPKVCRILNGMYGGCPTILIDRGEDLPVLPIQNMGDGFCRLALITTGLVFHRSKVLIVDEIDSGLHPTTMRSFWQTIISISQRFDVQVFCTTHSEEMIFNALAPFDSHREDITVLRFDRDDMHNTRTFRFDYDMLVAARDAGLDIR